MTPEWLAKILQSREKDWINLSEAAYGIVQYLGGAPTLDDAGLREVGAIPDQIPEDMKHELFQILRHLVRANNDFDLTFTTIGGHGRRANAENLRLTCAVLGFLGEAERDRVRQRVG